MRLPLNPPGPSATEAVSIDRPGEHAGDGGNRPVGPPGAPARSPTARTDEERLETAQRAAFGYFERMTNPANGLVRDSSRADAPASIAGSGFGMACQVAAAERGYVTRAAAARRVLATLRFFGGAGQGAGAGASGHRGFFYHFLDMGTGARLRRCELSTIDTAIVVVGALVAAAYFDGDDGDERELRSLAQALYRRVDWTWMLDSRGAVGHGWRPGRGFIPYAYTGYNEALFLYILALASPTHPIPASSYARWLSTYRWKSIYGREFLYAGPLFIHQASHAWIDFRGIRDGYMAGRGTDYFENSRQATYVQQEYGRRNPRGFHGYGAHAWGISASDGPGPAEADAGGRRRRFHGYRARGVPYGADDGTLSPWVVAASLPFAPEIVLPTLAALDAADPEIGAESGYGCSFNPSFGARGAEFTTTAGGAEGARGWIADCSFAIDQGPVMLMIENHRSALIWRLTRSCPYIVEGLRRAGFTGGWLETP